MSTTWAIVLAIFASITAPLIIVYFTNRQRRSELLLAAKIRKDEKEEDHRREDEVAAKAARAASLLLEAQQETTRRTDEVARLAAVAQQQTSSQLTAVLDQGQAIHTLVNQRLTNVTEKALDYSKNLLEVLEEQIQAQRDLGLTPTAEALQRVESTRQGVHDLKDTLATRAVQQAAVDDSAAAAAAAAKPGADMGGE